MPGDRLSRASREAGLDCAYLHRLIKKHGVETKEPAMERRRGPGAVVRGGARRAR
ncbi:MAG: hypothetical protein INH41_16370 [Myxococcaceae bacterium]|jgi:hypothetical protein|nr:hypothetical protein [Myxococcaceae bacterium]MCA3013957.1 hypothetical protein [Myxococcaceae bacterium]